MLRFYTLKSRSSLGKGSQPLLSSSMALNQASLLTELLQVQCHFTWGLRKNDTDLNDLQNRLEDDINFKLEKQTEIRHLFTFLAFTKYLEGLPEKALENLQKAEEHIRKHNEENCEKQLIVPYGNFAWMHYHMKDYSKSQRYLKKLEEIMERFPTESSSVFHAEVYGEMGCVFLRYSKKYYDKAKDCFQKALRQQPDEIEWNTGYAIALYRTESTCIEDSPALKQLRRTLELNPEDAVVMVHLGVKLAAYKNFEEATKLVEKALRLSPDDPHVTRYVAKFFRQHGSVEKSILLLKSALEQTATSAFLHHQMALCYNSKRYSLVRNGAQNRNWEEVQQLLSLAEHHLEEATSLRPSFVYAILDLATLYAEKKNCTKAEELFQKAFAVKKDRSDDLQKVHLMYGNFQLYHKRSESEAIKHYTEGIKIQKDNLDGKKCASKLDMLANKRILRNSQDSEAFGMLGYVHRVRDEKREAIVCYEKALTLDPGNEEFLTALCDLRLSLH